MKYVVIKTGGKQYRASEGDILLVERLQNVTENKPISFDEVLLYVEDDVRKVGTPTVQGVTVKGTVLGNEKGEKIRVTKYKAKVRYRRVRGHRQHLSRVKIDEIS